jgi:hypothetical protein
MCTVRGSTAASIKWERQVAKQGQMKETNVQRAVMKTGFKVEMKIECHHILASQVKESEHVQQMHK